MSKKTYEIVRVVRKAAVSVVTDGGNFDEVRNDVINKLTTRYPGLDEGTLRGGFDHEYLQALQKRVA